MDSPKLPDDRDFSFLNKEESLLWPYKMEGSKDLYCPKHIFWNQKSNLQIDDYNGIPRCKTCNAILNFSTSLDACKEAEIFVNKVFFLFHNYPKQITDHLVKETELYLSILAQSNRNFDIPIYAYLYELQRCKSCYNSVKKGYDVVSKPTFQEAFYAPLSKDSTLRFRSICKNCWNESQKVKDFIKETASEKTYLHEAKKHTLPMFCSNCRIRPLKLFLPGIDNYIFEDINKLLMIGLSPNRFQVSNYLKAYNLIAMLDQQHLSKDSYSATLHRNMIRLFYEIPAEKKESSEKTFVPNLEDCYLLADTMERIYTASSKAKVISIIQSLTYSQLFLFFKYIHTLKKDKVETITCRSTTPLIDKLKAYDIL